MNLYLDFRILILLISYYKFLSSSQIETLVLIVCSINNLYLINYLYIFTKRDKDFWS
jgi:hypothetical protein